MLLKAVGGVFIAVVGYYTFIGLWNFLNSNDFTVDSLPEDVWWGASKPEMKDDKIRPFTISTSNHVLERLKIRLNDTRFPNSPLKDISCEYGININYLKTIRSHWLNNYNWNSSLKLLNSLPQFKTTVSGLDIHFIHAKPAASVMASRKVIPILLLHGWPGSVREFYGLIPLLIAPRQNFDFVFEVVAPSLPGYGFSEAAAVPGLATAQMGVIFKKLMLRLGHKKFYIHGGDWGALVGRDMSILYPKNVLGFHSTMCAVSDPLSNILLAIGNYWPGLVVDKMNEHRLYPFSKYLRFMWLETGYLHLQATKPDTIGTALVDSPIGLAAYILEKFSTWTNPSFISLPDGGLTKKFTLDALLDNIMIYLTTDSMLTSMRLYSEALSANYKKLGFDRAFIKVPTACAQFPHEFIYSPPAILKRKYKNLVKVEQFSDGGHFASFELPDIVANDIWTSIPLFLQFPKNETSCC